MKVLQRYFASEIIRSVLFVLLALLALFSSFDMMSELQSINHGGYKLQHALLYVALGLPGYTYEFMPIAVLIGTIFVLAQFASNSEFTIMRAASMSTVMAGKVLLKIGLIFVVFTFIFGELISPVTSKLAERVKLAALGSPLTQEFRTGLWTKDQGPDTRRRLDRQSDRLTLFERQRNLAQPPVARLDLVRVRYRLPPGQGNPGRARRIRRQQYLALFRCY
jgi:lipopolysaccharide export LptBFGC system permease protein LptF